MARLTFHTSYRSAYHARLAEIKALQAGVQSQQPEAVEAQVPKLTSLQSDTRHILEAIYRDLNLELELSIFIRNVYSDLTIEHLLQAMADPLSVAASVAGLITVAVQTSKTITDIIQKSRKAPKECQDARLEVDHIRAILAQLQKFVLGASKPSRSRASLIMVEQVVIILTSCVTTFSELDLFVETLDSDERMGLLDKLRWSSKAKSLSEIIAGLQMHKTSLSLMLTILSCQTTLEAEENVDRLCNLVEEISKNNAELTRRLKSFDLETSASNADHGELTTSEHGHTAGLDLKPDTGPKTGVTSFELEDLQSSAQAQTIKRNNAGFAFEELLKSSRVYRRASSDESDCFSIVSAAGRTGSWSMLSGLSLSEISHIAILALPLYATDIKNRDFYDFDITGEESPPENTEDLTSRMQKFKRQWQALRSPKQTLNEPNFTNKAQNAQGVMGIPISKSIQFANVTISIGNEDGIVMEYGNIPMIVGKCGAFLKSKGIFVERIFETAGNPRRVKHLEKIFDHPPFYGKGVDWTGYTVHDCAGVLLRYLKTIPDGPLIPYEFYGRFSDTFRSNLKRDTKVADNPYKKCRILAFQDLIRAIPCVHRVLLVYILDLIAVFARKSNSNAMTPRRLAAAFHPSILSRKPEEMDATEHLLALDIIVFLINHQDRLIIDGIGNFTILM